MILMCGLGILRLYRVAYGNQIGKKLTQTYLERRC